jgi:YD repeat-containing protein
VLTVTGAKTGSPTIVLTYTYDLVGNVLTANDGSSNITYEYDKMGRCTKEVDIYNGVTYEKDYTYCNTNNFGVKYFYFYIYSHQKKVQE